MLFPPFLCSNINQFLTRTYELGNHIPLELSTVTLGSKELSVTPGKGENGNH